MLGMNRRESRISKNVKPSRVRTATGVRAGSVAFVVNSTLDAVDFAPLAGWAASGTVELIPGHCYLVRIGSTSVNYGKFRVTSLSAGQVVMDWAYQIDPNNRELKAQPAAPASPRVRRPASSLAASALKVRS